MSSSSPPTEPFVSVAFTWPIPRLANLDSVFKQARTNYRHLERTDSTIRYRLTRSNFFCQAYLQARTEPLVWIPHVLPDRRDFPNQGVPYKQICMSWPKTAVDFTDDDYDWADLHAETLWPDLRPTKAHLILAAVEHALRSWPTWLPQVSNDRRLHQPDPQAPTPGPTSPGPTSPTSPGPPLQSPPSATELPDTGHQDGQLPGRRRWPWRDN